MKKVLLILLILILIAASLTGILAIGYMVRPSDAATLSASELRIDLSSRTDAFLNNAQADALSELTPMIGAAETAPTGTGASAQAGNGEAAPAGTGEAAQAGSGESAPETPFVHLRKIYTLPNDFSTGEKPNAACYGESTNVEDVEAMLAGAAELLDGQQVSWNRDLPFKTNCVFRWYLDETILVLNWQEKHDGITFTISEVKIAHPSQFRRMLVDNTYGSGRQLLCTAMAADSNAILISNGDFYVHRTRGINIFCGTMYKFNSELDACFIDGNGDLRLIPHEEIPSEEEVRAMIDTEEISFSLSFGPILIKDGEMMTSPGRNYPVGECHIKNFRCSLGQYDKLHYIITTTTDSLTSDVILDMYNRGCKQAYALDGGQTSEQVFHGKVVSHILYGAERPVSDFIYFSTAFPAVENGEEGAK